MNPDHPLDLAEKIAQIDVGNPRQVSLKRAVSTAYYALFHALSQDCVDHTVGRGIRTARYWQIVAPIYRAVDHITAKKVLERLTKSRETLPALKFFARAFIELQAARVAADYDPSTRYRRKDTLDFIGQARAALGEFRTLPQEERTLLVVQLLFKPR